jgi:DNA-binding MarR family transcriptional regulator
MGRSRRDTLLPILRSQAQARVLATVFLAPDDEALHVRLIADRAGVPFSTVQREIDRLEEAGLVRSERFAQARVVRPNDQSPIAEDLRRLLLKTYGPAPIVAEALSMVPGVEEAYLFGSWAARYGGEAGPLPADIDLLVVGTPDVDAVHESLRDAEAELGREIQATIVMPAEWRAGRSGFLRTIRTRRLVELDLGDR